MPVAHSRDVAIDGRTVRWAGQRTRRRAEFVDAAIHAIARYGPDTSTEQIAEDLGVTRTKLYRYFDGANDLNRSVAQRAAEMITAELEPVWRPVGTPLEMITDGVSALIDWLASNANLYRYVARRSLTGDTGPGDVITDIKTSVGAHLAQLFAAYLRAFGLDDKPADPLGFGIAGLVESAASRWLDNPTALPKQQLVTQFAEWIWALIDTTLRAGGVSLDRNKPLGQPTQTMAVDAQAVCGQRDPGDPHSRPFTPIGMPLPS